MMEVNERGTIKVDLICYHCGDICKDKSIFKEDKLFCCQGCKVVYEILEENNLCQYYSLEEKPGITPSVRSKTKYAYLEDENIKHQLIKFTDGRISLIIFSIPQMHCSSCIWLLENLYKINPSVISSQVKFLDKTLSLKFINEKISLKEVVELLDSLGYEPAINLDSIEQKTKNDYTKKLYYRIGIAGFAFGNIMLFSFPEYLGMDIFMENMFGHLFGYLSLLISIPVVFYSASVYYIPAYKGLRNKTLNIDFPLSLGIFALFIRSVIDIFFNSGPGFFDSTTGLVFLLLLGKIFQNKTYETLNFERTYKSYFPLSVSVINSGMETTIPLANLKTGNRIIVRNGELIPSDSILFKGDANIDYSFVTGESIPVNKVLGEIVYAGGRQCGEAIELEVIKEVSQSYLTQLWNNDTFSKKHAENKNVSEFSNLVGKYFTIVVILIAVVSSLIWYFIDSSKMLNVFIAVLIVACPCALALAIPFTLGNTLRIFGKNKLYLKNTSTIENISKINSIVFDKTGTITQSGDSIINFSGVELSGFEKSLIKSLARHSTHPLSRKIFTYLGNSELYDVKDFKETGGKGICGLVLNNLVSLGSEKFIYPENKSINKVENSSRVYISINEKVRGFFEIRNSYRNGLKDITGKMEKNYDLHLLSGDNENEKQYLSKYFKNSSFLHFRQSPDDKLKYISSLQSKNKKVLMIGDGLNDAGAIKQSDVGISVSDDVSNFSPACDGILDSEKFCSVSDFIFFSKTAMKIIYVSFFISILYNLLGLSFAVRGLLTPLFAAILMPVSSISVVLFCVITTNFFAKRNKFEV